MTFLQYDDILKLTHLFKNRLFSHAGQVRYAAKMRQEFQNSDDTAFFVKRAAASDIPVADFAGGRFECPAIR